MEFKSFHSKVWKFESFYRKDSVLEESHNEFSVVSNRKFESFHRKNPKSESSHDWVYEVPFESLKVSIGKIKNMYMLT